MEIYGLSFTSDAYLVEIWLLAPDALLVFNQSTDTWDNNLLLKMVTFETQNR